MYENRTTATLDEYLEKVENLKDTNILLVIAFEQPWVIDWLLNMANRHIKDASILIFDNSRKISAKREIEQVCQKHRIPYLALPFNPTKHVNRSHGMAMQWVFRNIVCRIQPKRFGYIDHDLIPIRSVSIEELAGDQSFYGLLRPRYENRVDKRAWSLWAGYCVFDYRAVSGLPLNFLYDFSIGLDTGGQNYHVLYKNYDKRKIRFATAINMSSRLPEGVGIKLQVIDDCWYHIGSIGYNNNFESKSTLCKAIADTLEIDGCWGNIAE